MQPALHFYKTMLDGQFIQQKEKINMKTIQIILSIVFVLTTTSLFAKNQTKTETFKVSGNCESCETRIEKAAKLPGVAKAEWDVKTKLLTITFNSGKIKSDAVKKNIAAVGHDTPGYKAADKVYNALPACCKYR